MYLSKLCLNLRSRLVRRQIAQPYELHRTLWSSGFGRFDKETLGRVLFRIDSERAGLPPLLLVQSEREPDWSVLPGEFVVEKPAFKAFEPSFRAGQRLRFRLRANPTRKVGTPSKSERLAGAKNHGQRIALCHENDQIAWLLKKGMQGGFHVPGQWHEEDGDKYPDFRMEVVAEGWVRCGKEGHREGQFFAVRFDGRLVVDDPNLFQRTLLHGIGSAKGFGFGLLSIAPG